MKNRSRTTIVLFCAIMIACATSQGPSASQASKKEVAIFKEYPDSFAVGIPAAGGILLLVGFPKGGFKVVESDDSRPYYFFKRTSKRGSTSRSTSNPRRDARMANPAATCS
jgi:hypothetical protein